MIAISSCVKNIYSIPKRPMTKRNKANAIAILLDEFYPAPPIPLDHKDAYTLLIAVLLSAQCTDVRVNKITPLLFERADNPKDMVELSVDEIREIIKPCGLSPQKSKAIHGLSQMVHKVVRRGGSSFTRGTRSIPRCRS